MSAVTEKIVALFGATRRAEVEALPPIKRQEFAHLCRYWANVAEAPDPTLPEKLDAVLAGITGRDIDRLAPERAVALGAVLRRIADVADPPPAPAKTTEELFQAARQACNELRTKEAAGIIDQLTLGWRAEDFDEVHCFRPGEQPAR